MKFQKDGVVYDVTDRAHIDCFKAKGWEMVEEQTEETTEEQTEEQANEPAEISEEQKPRNKK